MAMTKAESLALVRELLKARDEEELSRIIGLNLSRLDGTFFAVLERSAQQLESEGKQAIAEALRRLGDQMVHMRMLI